MLALMIKMALCLLGALVLGFIIGWLLSKNLTTKKYLKKINKLTNNLLTSEDAVKKLKEINLNREEDLKTMMTKNKKNEAELERKTQSIWRIQRKLTASEQSLTENLNAKEYNQSLFQKNIELERLLEQKSKEMSGFEGVLIKAEEMIEERDKKIIELEQEHKKEHSEEEFEELIMTKDQFSYIEVQLSEYQKEIAHLQDINKKLEEKCAVKVSVEQELEKKEEDSELDDSAIVKLFGDTYKKIIKS
jgi:chromosome segregation ATPase